MTTQLRLLRRILLRFFFLALLMVTLLFTMVAMTACSNGSGGSAVKPAKGGISTSHFSGLHIHFGGMHFGGGKRK